MKNNIQMNNDTEDLIIKCPQCEKRDMRDLPGNIFRCNSCDLILKTDHLKLFLKNSYKSYRFIGQQRNRLLNFAYYLFTKRKTLLDALYEDVYEFFEKNVNKKNATEEAKEKWRTVLNKYYEYEQEYHLKNDIDRKIINPVPSRTFYRFKDKINENDFTQKYLTKDTMVRIIKFYFYSQQYTMFIICALLAFLNFRISEIVTIRIEDIDLKERKIISGKVVGFAKKGPVISFFPSWFGPFLEKYIQDNKSKNQFLFRSHTQQSRFGFLHPKTPQKYLRDIKNILKIRDEITNPHAWRDGVNSLREKMGAPDRHLDLLLNQKPKGVNRQNYLKRLKNYTELRELWDLYVCFKYSDFGFNLPGSMHDDKMKFQ